ncbi:MAG: protocatechuate 3,4-dioxygenase [Nitrospirales bacterium]
MQRPAPRLGHGMALTRRLDSLLAALLDTRADRALTRRQILGVLLGTSVGLAASSALGRSSQALCLLTPPQTEGPFYPIEDQLEKDNDLTRVKGRAGHAKGQVIYILGQVRDAQCRPVEGALVEIWQASANGRYNHPRDLRNPRPLDPNFQYRGTRLTNKEGRYLFKTIKPGQYPAGPDWIRPSHVHVKVHTAGLPELTTQMYFAGDPYHERDYILNDLPQHERNRVIVQLEKPRRDMEPDAGVCRFDLVL